MKTKINVGSIYRDEIEEPLFEELCRIYPQGSHARAQIFCFSLPDDDPTAPTLIDALARYGYRPLNYFAPEQTKKTFPLELIREYDTTDYEQAAYLVPEIEDYFDGQREGYRTDVGVLELVGNARRGQAVDPKKEIAYAGPLVIVVSTRLRQEMEQSGLVHLIFRETRLDRPRKVPLREPFWELTSDLILPPSNNFFHDEKFQPFDGDLRKGCYIKETPNEPNVFQQRAELHYSADALASVEPFDLALTHERKGAFLLRSYVASKHFYQFCVARNLKIKWWPVRIDAV